MRKKIYIGWFFVALAAMSCAREDVAPDEGDKIAFYVKTQQAVSASSRALIEDTDDLLSTNKQFPLYVTGEGSTTLTNKPVDYTANGVWQSDEEWKNGQEYTFYAYIASPLETATSTQGGVSNISNNGKILTLQQPTTYSANENVWADYLLSYRVSANGSNKGLVKLDLERVTACVELYMARSEKVGEVRITEIAFKDVVTKATFGISYHAVPKDEEGRYGMKNSWIVTPDENSKATYTFSPSSPLEIYTESDDRFDVKYRQMRFLTIPQTLIDGATLSISYTVDENGTLAYYQSDFTLSDYTPIAWYRGHKIRYFIGIDTSIKLEGFIEPWKSVDYIETTLLPKN